MRYVVAILLALVLLASAHAADIVRDVPTEARQGSMINVTLTARGTSVGDKFVIGEDLPDGASLQSWSVSGAQEGETFSFTEKDRSLIWEFTATSPTPYITYTVLMPLSGGSAKFDAVYAVSTGEHGNPISSVVLQPPLPVVPQMFVVPTPVILDMPTPSDTPTPELPLLLIGSIIAISIGLVYVVERHGRRHGMQPFGHYTTQFVMHLLGHEQPQPVQTHMPSAIVEEALQAAELAQVIDRAVYEHVDEPVRRPMQQPVRQSFDQFAQLWQQPMQRPMQSVQEPVQQPMQRPNEAQVWASPIFEADRL